MSNMSYCRMENTCMDVEDCINSVYNYGKMNPISSKEEHAFRRMIECMFEFMSDFGIIDSDGELSQDEIEHVINIMKGEEDYD